jgi:hypothetical protein
MCSEDFSQIKNGSIFKTKCEQPKRSMNTNLNLKEGVVHRNRAFPIGAARETVTLVLLLNNTRQ